ncbi:MAG: hypothetical protein ACJ8BW_29150 [Ktedonobacteraceae bacterium]
MRSLLRLPWSGPSPWPLAVTLALAAPVVRAVVLAAPLALACPLALAAPVVRAVALSPCLRPGTPPTPGLSNGDEPPARPGPLHRLHFLKSALIGVALAAILAPLRPKCIVIPLLDDGYT